VGRGVRPGAAHLASALLFLSTVATQSHETVTAFPARGVGNVSSGNSATDFSLANLPRQASVVIVGGGMAGLELAAELDRRGHTGALVLEAGPAADTRHVAWTHSKSLAHEIRNRQPTSDT